MLSESRIFAPFSQTSAIVARPSKGRTRRPVPAKRARYQTSLSCNGVGFASSHRPALRSASAAVPGTGAAIQPCAGIGLARRRERHLPAVDQANRATAVMIRS